MAMDAMGNLPQQGTRRGRLTRARRSPVLAILLVAPFLGEVTSTATPPLDLLLPWNLALMAALYGCGALICRELVRRHRLGLLGLCLLGAAYAVYEEALVDRFWFDPEFQEAVGVGAYGRVWHTNLLLAVHLTAFHVAVSICSSILLVERLFPAYRERAWTGRRGLTFAGLALAAVVPITSSDFARVPAGQLLAAGGLGILLVWGAFRARRPAGRPDRRPRRRRPVILGLIAFTCTATHFTLVYALPSTGIAWPIGVVCALAPIAAGILLIRRLTAGGGAQGPDGLAVVTGILAFFILLDAAVGLGGRYDLTVGAVGLALGLWWLHRRERRQP